MKANLKMEPKIDKEFEALCNPLTPEERNLLETNIERDGLIEPISIWSHDGSILDGHNRFDICKSLRIEYATKAIDAETRSDAINWIIAKQLGRRNVTDEQKSYLRGKRYQAEKNPGGGQLHQNDVAAAGKTSTRLAAEYGVGSATIERDSRFASAVDVIEKKEGPAAKAAVLNGTSGLTMTQVRSGKLPSEAPPASMAQSKRRLRASEKRSKAADAVSAIATESVGEIGTANQRQLVHLHDNMRAIATIVASLLADGEKFAKAATKEHWTPHAKTRLRANLSAIKRDISRIDQFLK